MKMKYIALLLSALFVLSLQVGCKKEVTPPLSVDEIIIGDWYSVLKKENGATQPSDGKFDKYSFRADSTVSRFYYQLYNQDTIEVDFPDDNIWWLIENNTIIEYGSGERFTIANITTDSLRIEYEKVDINQVLIEHEDTFVKAP